MAQIQSCLRVTTITLPLGSLDQIKCKVHRLRDSNLRPLAFQLRPLATGEIGLPWYRVQHGCREPQTQQISSINATEWQSQREVQQGGHPLCEQPSQFYVARQHDGIQDWVISGNYKRMCSRVAIRWCHSEQYAGFAGFAYTHTYGTSRCNHDVMSRCDDTSCENK